MAGKNPFYIAIQNGCAHIHGKAGNGASGRTADTGQLLQSLHIGREDTAMISNDTAGCPMQVAGTGVITQPGPQMEHLVLGRGCELLNGRILCNETQEIRDHRLHLGLLQHDFRQPHPVGRLVLLPGQVVPTMLFKPGQETRCKLRGCATAVVHWLGNPPHE